MKTKSKRRIFSPETKAEMAARAHQMRAEGRSYRAITDELGVLEGSIRLWMDQHPPAPRLAPVKVIAPKPTTAPLSGLVLTTPDGHRLEGLDLDTALLALEMLR